MLRGCRLRYGLIFLLICWGSFTFVVAQNAVCGFSHRKVITIQGSRIAGGAHTNFPLLISHTDTNLRDTANGGNVTSASGFDIIFADSFGTALDFQLEHYDPTTGSITAWVRMPSLTNGVDVDFSILYGKESITADRSTTDVWGTDYHGIWHLNNNLADATSNGINGTNNGSVDLDTGIIAGARTFTDPNHWIELNSFPNMSSSFTISAWINTNNSAEVGQRIFCDDANNSNGGYALSLSDGAAGSLRFYIRGLSNAILDAPSGGITNNTWYHVMAMYNQSTLEKYIYVNGSQVASQSATGSLGADAGNASIGGEVAAGESGNRFSGDLDEIKLRAGVLNTDWITTEYRSQSQPTSYPGTDANDFYTVGAEEQLMDTSVVSGDWDDPAIWATGTVPTGLFKNVVIQNEVDIDAASSNYDACNCTLDSDGNQNVFLNISSTRVLNVLGDLVSNYNGAGISPSRIQLINTAVVNVNGNVIWNRTNSNVDPAANTRILVYDDATLNVDSSIYLNESGGDDMAFEIRTTANVNVDQDFNINHTSGDLTRIEIDGSGILDVAGDVNIVHSGGNDVWFYLNNVNGTAAVCNVGGDFNVNHTAGDDIEFLVDDVGSQLNITGAFNATLTGAFDTQRMFFNLDAGGFNAASVNISRGGDFGEVNFDMDGGNLTSSGFQITSGGTLFNNGLVRFDVDQSSVLTCNGNFTTNMTGGDDFLININVGGGTTAQFNVSGNFSLTKSDGDDFFLFVDDDNSLFHVGGNFTYTTTGGEELRIDLDENATFDVDGNFSITHSGGQNGLFDLEHAGNLSNPTFNVDGDFSILLSGGADVYTLSVNGGTFSVGDDMSLQLTSAGATEYISMNLENDAIMNVDGDLTLTLSGGDDLHIRSGVTTAATAQLNIGGNWTLDHNGATGGDDLTPIFNDDSRITVDGNLIVDGNFAGADLLQLTLNNTTEMTVLGNIQFVAAAQGKSEIELNNSTVLHIGGNFQRAAAPNDFGILDCNNTSTLEFIGTAAQIFPKDDGGGTDEFDFQNVVINNTFGASPQITMEGLATVHAGISFVDGIVASTASNLLVIDNGASTTGASDASHVEGVVRKVGNTPAGNFAGIGYAFPVGDNGIYRPIYISAPALTTDQFEATYLHVNPDPSYDRDSLDNALFVVSSVEYWELNRTAGTSSVAVSLSWDTMSSVGNLSTLRVCRWDGSEWTPHGNTATSGTTSAGTVTSDPISNFSPFTLGSTGNANPLPVELLSFTGRNEEMMNVLNWTTASEIKNDYFTLERMDESAVFQKIAQIPGHGTSNAGHDYEFIDSEPLNGLNYYRLSQTDFDGLSEYFNTIMIDNFAGSDDDDLTLIPNPTQGELTLHTEIELEGDLRIYNAIGELVFSDVVRELNGKQLNLESLKPGVYLMRASCQHRVFQRSFIISE